MGYNSALQIYNQIVPSWAHLDWLLSVYRAMGGSSVACKVGTGGEVLTCCFL